MDSKRWYQIRWTTERTDNISAVDLEDAYAQAWRICDSEIASGFAVDGDSIDIEDMASGKIYHVAVEYLEGPLDLGWADYSRRLQLVDPVLEDILAGKQDS